MQEVHGSLHAMGAEQYLLAFLFLASYAFALSDFIGARGRALAVGCALTAAIAFAAMTDPWEHGVLVVAFALVAMGLFSATVWGLWALCGWSHVIPVATDADGTRPVQL